MSAIAATATIGATKRTFKATANAVSKVKQASTTGLKKAGENVATTIKSTKHSLASIFEYPMTPALAPVLAFANNRRLPISPAQKPSSFMNDVFQSTKPPQCPAKTMAKINSAASHVKDLSILQKMWTDGKLKNPVKNAYRHWQDHKHDFPELHNAKEYVEKAKSLGNNPSPTALSKTRANGDKVIYDPPSDMI